MYKSQGRISEGKGSVESLGQMLEFRDLDRDKFPAGSVEVGSSKCRKGSVAMLAQACASSMPISGMGTAAALFFLPGQGSEC